MGATPLITLAQQYWRAPERFRQEHRHAWIVWRLGRPTEEPIVAPTLGVGRASGLPNVGDPLAIAVTKGAASVFGLGITVGRTENNDVVLRHEEVSRFHAYFTETAQGLALVDAESKNGTFVDGERLEPKRPRVLPAQCTLRFGDLEVQYYAAEALLAQLAVP